MFALFSPQPAEVFGRCGLLQAAGRSIGNVHHGILDIKLEVLSRL